MQWAESFRLLVKTFWTGLPVVGVPGNFLRRSNSDQKTFAAVLHIEKVLLFVKCFLHCFTTAFYVSFWNILRKNLFFEENLFVFNLFGHSAKLLFVLMADFLWPSGNFSWWACRNCLLRVLKNNSREIFFLGKKILCWSLRTLSEKK